MSEVRPVQDKPTENGIKLNNILTFLVLSVMSWVGYNINTMKTDIAEMKGFQQAHEVRISRNERDITSISSRVHTLEGVKNGQ